MAILPWQKAVLIQVLDETPDTKRFFFEAKEVTNFDFVPGQFVTLDLPIHEKSNKRWRSYSIASAPDQTNLFELLIVLNPMGTGTPYLFNQLKVGDEVVFRGPQGIFNLHTPLEKELYLICTGTGIAPFRSMVQHIQRHDIPHRNIFLIYGCRKQNNLLYYEEMRQLEQELSDFHYIPTLSREEWAGRTGYVHDIYEELAKQHPNAMFYLCGWRQMIDEAKQRILQLGYAKNDIHLEIYG